MSIQDIVRHCNISKKELYNTFGNKEGIIKEVFDQDIEITSSIFQNAIENNENAILELLDVHTTLMDRYGNVNQVLFFDLKKYYSEIGNDHKNRKLEHNLNFITRNIKRGIQEKLFRSDFDIHVVARLWVSKFELIQEQKLFPLTQFDLKHLTREFLLLHLRSISTTKGYEILNRYLETENIQPQ